MKNTHHLIRRPMIANLVIGLLILLLAGCQTGAKSPRPTETVPPIAAESKTPSSKATPMPTRAAERSIPAGPIQYVSAAAVSLSLPETWIVERLGGDAFAERIQNPSAEKQAPLEQVQAAIGAETEILWAISQESEPGGQGPTQLLVTTMPRHGLRLDEYVAAVTTALTENQGVSVKRAGIVYDVREDGQPLAIVEYRIEAADRETDTGGYQIVHFDGESENLMMLTFTVAASELSEQIPLFHEIAASARAD